ncbi:ribosomal protein S6 [Echria macrotheca]|uniref:Small ribosomal subunit protein bS6m n=1 Tax=Echria macrotheca TaxID=438768 RepID=A0AAJ0F1Q8_9PEZI|nr:ribosomal protein S6 [Echria macrotheca]
MLYETIGIARVGNIAEVKEMVLSAGQLILRNGGIIRDIQNWGVFRLPKPVSRHQVRHNKGHYFVMRYDAAATTNEKVRQTLGVDPRIIRTANVKLGDGKLERLSQFGKVPWRRFE